jgi:PAS domain-containing protein
MSIHRLSRLLAELGLLDSPLSREDGKSTAESLELLVSELEKRVHLPPEEKESSGIVTPLEKEHLLECDEIFFESPMLEEVKKKNWTARTLPIIEFDELPPEEESADDWEEAEPYPELADDDGKVFFDPIDLPTNDWVDGIDLHSVLQRYPYPMWLLDTELCLLDFNDAYEELLFEYIQVFPVVGESVLQWALLDPSPETCGELYTKVQAGEQLSVVRTLETSGGRRHLQFNLQPVKMQEPLSRQYVLVIAEDHSRWASLEKETHLLRASFESLQEVSDDLVWGLDREMRFLFLNSAFRNAYLRRSYTRPRVGQKLCFEHFPAEAAREWREIYERAFLGEEFTILRSRDIRRKTYYFEYYVRPVYGNNDTVLGVCVRGKNISHTEEHLDSLRKRLKQKKESS